MSQRKPAKVPPKLCLHKASGRAVVRLNGRDHYCGVYGTPEAQAEYDKKIAEWRAGAGVHLRPGVKVTVAQVAEAYLAHAGNYYLDREGRPDGKTLDRLRRALRPAVELYGPTPAAEFGPVKLDAARERLVDQGYSRKYVNALVQALQRAFRWATARELVPGATHDSLMKLEPLKRGHTRAPERPKRRPAQAERVRAAQARMSPTLRDMTELQWLAGMRPGEVCAVRPCDINTGGVVELDGELVALPGLWVYEPPQHKRERAGERRFVLLGPACQQILAPYMARPPESYCFSPADVLEAAGMKPATRKSRRPGACYRRESYTRAVAAACDRAFPPPAHLARAKKATRRRDGKPGRWRWETDEEWRSRLGEKAWAELQAHRKATHWSPHRLRHARSTEVGSAFTPEHARILLGHRDLNTTRNYLVDDLKKAAEAARKLC